MIIQNYSNLAKDTRQSMALQILESGLESAKPQKKLKKIVNPKQILLGKKIFKLANYNAIYLVAFGKAANAMVKGVESNVNVKRGFIVVPKGTPTKINKKFKIFKTGHPIPDHDSVHAAKTIKKFLNELNERDLAIFLVSGGSSALLSWPDGITLNEKILLNKKLLESGATIQEINCVRKHLSKIKGGRLVERIRCDAISLVMSDVLGDDLSSIASGTTYFDDTTFNHALKILEKYGLENKIPKSALRRLRLGALGKIPETPKKTKINHSIILTNADCIKVMKKKSKQLGISVKTIKISGDVTKAATKLVSLIPKRKNSCIIFGGETTVKVKGRGKGGRNQEIVLRILKKTLNSKQDITIASLGTDGIDGNTKFAGAITKNILKKPSEIKSYLDTNDSNSFFKKYGGLIKTGPTSTNLMDIGLILV